jgi:hypothetical protein
MSTKICACCGQSFPPDPRVKNHTYRSAPDCQKERRKQWRQTKMKTDPDYRDNKSRIQRDWLDRNPNYWREYRKKDVNKLTLPLFSALHKLPIMRTVCLAAGPRSSVAQTSWD